MSSSPETIGADIDREERIRLARFQSNPGQQVKPMRVSEPSGSIEIIGIGGALLLVLCILGCVFDTHHFKNDNAVGYTANQMAFIEYELGCLLGVLLMAISAIIAVLRKRR